MKQHRADGLPQLKLVRVKEYITKGQKIALLPLLIGGVFAVALLANADSSADVSAASPTASPSDSDILATLRAEIKGHGKEPAETVYKNIQILKGKPAGAVERFLQCALSRACPIGSQVQRRLPYDGADRKVSLLRWSAARTRGAKVNIANNGTTCNSHIIETNVQAIRRTANLWSGSTCNIGGQKGS